MTKSIETEEGRISTAYAKRQGEFRYSWFNPSYVFLMHERERRMLIALEQHGFASLENINILEIGCGTGYWLRQFIEWGAQPQNMTGVDILPERVAIARQLCPESVHIECRSAASLAFPDACFDLVLQSTVFSSVLDPPTRQQIASEMLRVVKSDGAILWYDFHVNNPRNQNVQGVKRREIFQLFQGCRIELQRITLAPPIARLVAPYSLMTCYMFERFRIFNTHFLGVIRKP